ncbi:MAG: hypothetical protein DRP42_04055 [Tenericutes bacterium]|nr:MAG: hypothetical protein DRP42_04055 [Mycoplasmatota bacterium]
MIDEEDNFVLFEPLFIYDKFKLKADVITKINGKVTLIEAKAVTYSKEVHAYDIKFQQIVMDKAGYDTSQ